MNGMNGMNSTYYVNKDNMQPSKATLDDKHQVIRDIGKSGYMLRLIIGSCLILVFFLWEVFQIIVTMSKLSDQGQGLSGMPSYSLNFSVLLGQLMNQLGIVLALSVVVTLIRMLPTIAFIAIFVKSKKYNSAESMFPFFTMVQVFGVLEALIWGGLLIYETFTFIKYQVPIFSGNGISTMIIVVFLLIMVFKTIQGILLIGFVKYIKNYINTGDCPPKPFNGMKFVIVMLSTLNAIIFTFLLGSVIITQGIDLFFKTLPQLWPIYLFFFAQMFSNMCAMRLLNVFKSRTRRLEYNAAPSPSTYHQRPFNTPYPSENNTPAYRNQQNNNQYQNPQRTGYQQNNSQYQNQQRTGYQQNNNQYQNQQRTGYQQNNSQYQSGQGFGYQQNNGPYQNGQGFGGYQQNNSPFLNDQSFGSYQPNNSPFQDIPFSGSGKPFEDLSDFNNNNQ